MLTEGTLFAGYRIERPLGRGGMGIVYEARQLSLDRTVALKVLGAQLGDDDGFRERFRQEGRIQAGIDHPHIVTVHEAGEHDGVLFLAMQLVRGPTLKELVVARQLDAARALRILRMVAEALDCAHDRGLIHRDVKPQNVLVGARDHAYLADFGLTKSTNSVGLTQTGQFVGTIDYVAPEQIRGDPATAATDIYALAAVLHECLTGVVPYPRRSDAAALYAHLSEPPPRITLQRPDLPAALDAVLARGMAKDPAARHGTASELVEDAEHAMGRGAGIALARSGGVPGSGRAATETLVARPASTARHDTVATATRTEPETGLPGGVAESEDAPTVPIPPPEPPKPVRRPRPPAPVRRRRRRAATLGAVGTVVLAAAAAVLLALIGGGSERAGEREGRAAPLRGTAVTPDVEVRAPDGWRSGGPPPAIPGIDLEDPAVLRPPREEDAGILAGGSDADTPALLPAALLERLPARPDGRSVTSAGHEALRYSGLVPRGYDGRLTVQATPTTAGVAMLVCFAPEREPSGFGATCARVADTLRPRRGDPVALGPDPGYAARLSRVVRRLDGRRVPERGRLASARTRRGQARSATRLADAFASARTSVRRLKPYPADGRATRRVASALGASSSAYRRLAAAARHGRARSYERARSEVRRTETLVRRRIAALEGNGYRVR